MTEEKQREEQLLGLLKSLLDAVEPRHANHTGQSTWQTTEGKVVDLGKRY